MADVNLPLPFDAYTGEKPYVFASYAHRDGHRVYPELRALYDKGFRIWYDEGIDPGNEWPDEIAKALDRASLFLVFISPAAVDSRNVRNEINFALNREKPFIAIYLEDIQLPPGLDLRMGDIQAIMKWRMSGEHYAKKIVTSLPSQVCGTFPKPNDQLAVAKREQDSELLTEFQRTSQEKETQAAPTSAEPPAVRDGIKGLFYVEDLAFHPSGELLAWFSGEGFVSILDLNTRQIVSELQGYVTKSPNGDITGMNPISFSADGRLVAVGHDGGFGNGDGVIDVYDWKEKTIEFSLRGPETGVTYLGFDPTGQFFAASFYEHCTKIWKVPEWEECDTFDDYGPMAMSAGCQFFALTSRKSNTLRVLSRPENEWWEVEGTYNGRSTISSDARWLAIANDRDFNMWRISDRKRVSPPRPEYPSFTEIEWSRWDGLRELWSVTFSPDGSQLAMVFNCGAALFNMNDGKVKFVVEDDSFNYVPRIEFDPTGRWLAVCDTNPPMYIWNVKEGRVEMVLNQ